MKEHKKRYGIVSIILAIAWAVIQFLLLDQFAYLLNIKDIYKYFTGKNINHTMKEIAKKFNVPYKMFHFPTNFYSLSAVIVTIFAAIVVNLIAGALDLLGIDAVLTTIVNSIIGPNAINTLNLLFDTVFFSSLSSKLQSLTGGASNSLATLLGIEYLGNFNYSQTIECLGNCNNYDSQFDSQFDSQSFILQCISDNCTDSSSSHRHHRKNKKCKNSLYNLGLTSLSKLGLLNVIRLGISLKNGDFFDASNIIANGIMTGIDVQFQNIPNPKKLLLPCSFYNNQNTNTNIYANTKTNTNVTNITIVNFIRKIALFNIGNFYFRSLYYSGLPTQYFIPPSPILNL